MLHLTYIGLCSIMKYIGLEYKKIDACPNDHTIYYEQYASKFECPKYGISRY